VENRYDGIPGYRPRVRPATQKLGRQYVSASRLLSTALTLISRNIRRSDRGNLETSSRSLQGRHPRRLVGAKFYLVAFHSSLQFSSSAVLSLPLGTQESEENFDLALIASLEIDVVPYLGDSRVSDYLILQLGKMLQSGSQLQQPEDGNDSEVNTPNTLGPDVPRSKLKSKSKSKPKPRDGKSPSRDSNIVEAGIGTTRSGKLVPRERFSYWCFDLLLLICSDVAKGIGQPRFRFSVH